MKDILESSYSLKIIGIIKIKENIYKIKTDDQLYVVKIVKDTHIEQVYEYIQTMHVHCFVDILLNKNNEVLTRYNEQYLYVMPYLDNSQGKLQDIKIKMYFETLAYLHEKTFYQIKVNQEYYEMIEKDILKVIEERCLYYEQMITHYENTMYRSPSQWLLMMNYHRIYHSLNRARDYLQKYRELCTNHFQIRVCLTYRNFDYDHICLKQKALLSIEDVCIDLPIYDLFYMYQKIPDVLFDLDCCSQYYFCRITLKEEEKALLCCLMSIVPIVKFGKDEIDNIIKLSRLLYYLDSIYCFIESCH